MKELWAQQQEKSMVPPDLKKQNHANREDVSELVVKEEKTPDKTGFH